jgi:hypothetical protein
MFSGRDGYFSHDDDEGVTVIRCRSAYFAEHSATGKAHAISGNSF